jgi:hypothetical protein
VLYKISHGEPSLDGLDEGLRHLVAQALEKDPAARPSAQQVLDALTGRPHADTAETADSVGRTWAVPNSRRTMLDPPATAALPPREAGGSSPLRRGPLVVGAATLAALLVLGTGAFLLLRGTGGPPSKTTTVYADDFSSNDSGLVRVDLDLRLGLLRGRLSHRRGRHLPGPVGARSGQGPTAGRPSGQRLRDGQGRPAVRAARGVLPRQRARQRLRLL